MIDSLASPLRAASASPFLGPRNPLHFSSLRVLPPLKRTKKRNEDDRGGRRGAVGACRAELAQDAPFALAIGACVLNSLIFPIPSGTHDDDDDDVDSAIDSTDMRFAVMGIISFIPYFNWMSWIFAWLDSGRQRYLVYSIVYLAPYLRTNLSLSPEESWLPIASILFCIIHVQLEASIRNGDLNNIQQLNEYLKLLFPMNRKKDAHFHGHQGLHKEARKKEHAELPSAQKESKKRINEWGASRKRLEDLQHLNDDEDVE